MTPLAAKGDEQLRAVERALDEIAGRTQQHSATLPHKTDLFDRVRLQSSKKGKHRANVIV